MIEEMGGREDHSGDRRELGKEGSSEQSSDELI